MKGALVSMEAALDTLSSMERQAAKYIIEHPSEVVNLSVQQLALRAEVSEATIVRLAKSLKFKGYTDLKLRISADLSAAGEGITDYQPFKVGHSIQELMESVTNNNIKSIHDTMDVIDVEAVAQAVESLNAARKIAVFGVGASSIIAEDFRLKVNRINKWCESASSGDMQAVVAANLSQQDVVIGISYSGNNQDVLHALKLAKANGAKIISLTHFGINPISELSDIQLYTSSLEQNFRKGAMASRIAQLNVIDMLYVGMVVQNYESSTASIERTQNAVRR
ncbi:DNA-binding MurR/RpiR family transcriptional regulator [Paenibacillus phyllosphaerae]|uniref:DNA-binding MurR/RpiR family transcriptional regulator n=1 Tax=Paenibacillus phyllosphaerae TaxID=274593 RepID=A0A7W5AZ52_9BACL|nr:MurR/RpiR family transcriptional regulator [Paenibacillus phyllosphaerae]MBB3111457.1 DNA-binding MurR/RpiR family transcriptional regulator [Paenibacillus phyllosphaerae]